MLYDPDKLLIIAGPCSLETEEVSLTVARELLSIQDVYPELNIIFKGSFDKANRTSLESDRGPGLKKGLEILRNVKAETGFDLATDYHLPEQAEPVAEVCEVLQVPAFLCRQTDLLMAGAKTGKTINTKKGQFLSPFEMEYVVSKLEQAGAHEIWLTDRGTTFGYQNLVVDMRNVPIMQKFNHPVILDATHSVQLPGASGGISGGKREFIPTLANAALAAGVDGLFMETHPDPNNAISDAASQIPLDKLESLIPHWIKLWELSKKRPQVDL